MNYTNYGDIKPDQRIENVPAYRIDDIRALDHRMATLSCLRDDFVRTLWIRPEGKQGPQNFFVLATPELTEFVEKNYSFAILSGKLTKKPKLYKKTVVIQHVQHNCVYVGVAI